MDKLWILIIIFGLLMMGMVGFMGFFFNYDKIMTRMGQDDTTPDDHRDPPIKP